MLWAPSRFLSRFVEDKRWDRFARRCLRWIGGLYVAISQCLLPSIVLVSLLRGAIHEALPSQLLATTGVFAAGFAIWYWGSQEQEVLASTVRGTVWNSMKRDYRSISWWLCRNRRVVGIVMLILSLGIWSAWLRSRIIEDTVSCGGIHDLQFVHSANGKLTWWAWESDNPPGEPYWIARPIYEDEEIGRQPSFEFYVAHTPDFGYLDSTALSERYLLDCRRCWSLPYWMLVIPSTLMSAYLLLSRSDVQIDHEGEELKE